MNHIINPFIISEKVVPDLFCDRKEETSRMISLLINRNNVVLISHRRVGKTGLIQYCFEQSSIKQDFYLFYIDILSTSNLQEFIFLLGKEIVSTIQPLGKKMITNFINTVRSLTGKLGYDPLNGVPTINFQLGDITRPDYTLKEIFDYLNKADKPCIVAIDEFQQVAKYPEKNIEALLRSHIQVINNCRFIFSGSERHLLEQMFLSPSRPFYSSSAFMELKVIPREIYVDFIVRLFKERNKKIDEFLAGKIYDIFEGYTFYIQRICNGVFEMTPPATVATEEMLDRTLEITLYSYDALFRERLFRLSTRQKELLFAIASEGKVEKISSVEFIQKYALTSASAVQTALKALMRMELVAQENGKTYIEEKFFDLWVKKEILRLKII